MNGIELVYLTGWIGAMVVARVFGPNIDCNEKVASLCIGISIGLLLALMSRMI